MTASLTLRVNGKEHEVRVDPDTPLLYVLRNQLALNGPKYGCGLEQCGSCMVLMDGKATPSCRIPVSAVTQRTITTLEGLTKVDGELHPVQHAFVEQQAAQCGYCLNGLVISAVALLQQHSRPGEKEIREALHPNLCRCSIQTRAIRAIQAAAENMNP